MQTRHLLYTAILLSAFSLQAFRLFSQQVAQPAPAAATPAAAAGAGLTPAVVNSGTIATSGTSDDVVQMSVFNVSGESDHGYQAVNTTSGSRLNTPLKDTAASIQAFTEDFLNDVGATTVEDMLAYAGNMEAEAEDATNGFNDNPTRGAESLDNRFRIRGIQGGLSMDGMDTGVPVDLYNVERAEISGGANSIQFGMGAQGGLLALTSKRANMQRNTARAQYVIGTWVNPGKAWNYNRATFDYNIVLMPKRWAFRLGAVWQDGDNASWRKWQFNHTLRINPLMTMKPFGNKGPTISIGYEKGKIKQSTSRTSAGNAADGITAWLDAGSPIIYHMPANANDIPVPNVNYSDGTSRAPVTVQNGAGNNPYWVLVNNDQTLYDFRRTYHSTSSYAANAGSTRLPQDLSSYYYSTVGPAGWRQNNFERWNLNIEQNIGNWNFELAYNHNKTIAVAHSPNSIEGQLFGDASYLTSSSVYGSDEAAIVNPYAGMYYMEDRWMRNDVTTSNDGVRLTTNYNLNLKSWGRHRIIGFLEHVENETYRNIGREILVDNNQVPYSMDASGAPNDNGSFVRRRNYAKPGDFSNYYQGTWDTPVTNLVIGDKVYHTTYYTDNDELHHTQKSINTAMLALQSYWFNDKLVTTLGLRLDDISYRQAQKAQITNPQDPRILNHTKVINEWALDGTWESTTKVNPWTLSTGAVWHVTNRFSTFLNYSTNRGAPNLDGFTALPDGLLPPLVKGQTFDYGVMFDILGDGKWTFRLTKYDTRQFGSYTIHPAGQNVVTGDNALGSTNMLRIYDALYYLQITNGNYASTAFTANTGVNSDGTGKGPMKPDEYAVNAPKSGWPNGVPPIYSIASVDVLSQGYELEMTASPTKNIDLRFTFAYTNRNRTNVFPEIFAFYDNNMIPKFLEIADRYNPNSLDGKYYVGGAVSTQYSPVTGLPIPPAGATSLHDYVIQQLYTGSGSLRVGLNNQIFNQSGAMGNRPFQFTLTGKYKFLSGILKGFTAGGSVRFRSYNLMIDPASLERKLNAATEPYDEKTIGLAPDMYYEARSMIHGNSQTFWDMFMTYKMKDPFWHRNNLTFQLNIRNIFTSDIVTIGRVFDTGQIRRVYINEPRTIRLTATIDF